MSEDVEDESNYESEPEAQVIEVPAIYEEGSAFYVCSECGSNLTEIPYYNRYYCESCGLHY